MPLFGRPSKQPGVGVDKAADTTFKVRIYHGTRIRGRISSKDIRHRTAQSGTGSARVIVAKIDLYNYSTSKKERHSASNIPRLKPGMQSRTIAISSTFRVRCMLPSPLNFQLSLSVFRLKLCNPLLKLWSKVANNTLHWPSCRVT